MSIITSAKYMFVLILFINRIINKNPYRPCKFFGEDAYAEDQSNAFEKSLSVCVDKLKRQLIKRNEIERAVR